MRLLNTETLELEEHLWHAPKYAILSHRWGPDEVIFHDFPNGKATKRRGWSKLIGCCEKAKSRGISYVWIDTCCIDKSSSAELTESINSMYAFYENAEECYAYLGDVHASGLNSSLDEIVEEMSDSAWFTRGWTLQELIAPSRVLFFNCDWEMMGTKSRLSQHLQIITQISWRLLAGKASLTDFSLAQRMAWASARTTTRPEDEAYSLLGIFQVNMPMLYGEGRNAFRRLQEEIIKQSDDQTLFAWHDERAVKPVLAPSAACFKDLHDLKCIYATNDARFGHTLSNSGLNIKLMLIPWAMDVYVAPLSCGQTLSQTQNTEEQSRRGYKRMGIFLRRTKYEDHLVRVSITSNNRHSDFVMLDSDVVATKRDAFRIKDRQVFVRQSLVDMPDDLVHSFTFSFHHPQMFRHGPLPTPPEVFNNLFKRFATIDDPNYGFIQERYGHYESAVFNVSNLSPTSHPQYIHLGYDLNFAPVCLITTELGNDDHDVSSLSTKVELNGMSNSINSVASLPWLLSKVDAGKSADTVLAFKAKSGASTVVQCAKLSLRIDFELKTPLHKLNGYINPPKMWHVTFEPLTSIPNTPITPMKSQVSLTLPYHERPSDTTLSLRPKRGKLWVRLFTLGKAKSRKRDWTTEEWVGTTPESGTDSEIAYERFTSNITTAPYSRSTAVPSSSLSPDNVVTSNRYSLITPGGDLITPVGIYEDLASILEDPDMEHAHPPQQVRSRDSRVARFELDAVSTFRGHANSRITEVADNTSSDFPYLSDIESEEEEEEKDGAMDQVDPVPRSRFIID